MMAVMISVTFPIPRQTAPKPENIFPDRSSAKDAPDNSGGTTGGTTGGNKAVLSAVTGRARSFCVCFFVFLFPSRRGV